MNLFGNRVIADMIKVNMKSLGSDLIQYDWCPCKKGSLETDSYAQGECHVNMKTAVYMPRRELRRDLFLTAVLVNP